MLSGVYLAGRSVVFQCGVWGILRLDLILSIRRRDLIFAVREAHAKRCASAARRSLSRAVCRFLEGVSGNMGSGLVVSVGCQAGFGFSFR